MRINFWKHAEIEQKRRITEDEQSELIIGDKRLDALGEIRKAKGEVNGKAKN